VDCWINERTLAERRSEGIHTRPATTAWIHPRHTSGICLFEQVTKSDQLILLNLDFLIHFIEFGVLNVLSCLNQIFISAVDFGLKLLDLLLERHDEESFLLVSLSSLHNWCECSNICLILLGILDKLILLKKIFYSALFSTILIFQDPDLSLQFHIFFSVRVCSLLVLNYFHLQLLRKLGLLRTR
jgi:hypothetical protein